MHLKSVAIHPDRYPTQERYPFNLRVFHETRMLAFDSPVTMFVGENGTGKSNRPHPHPPHPIRPIPYEQTDHYRIYKAFLTDISR
jgi:hypothetical protein